MVPSCRLGCYYTAVACAIGRFAANSGNIGHDGSFQRGTSCRPAIDHPTWASRRRGMKFGPVRQLPGRHRRAGARERRWITYPVQYTVGRIEFLRASFLALQERC